MIVSDGENVYPREVENALFEHPAVIDAAVIGIPDQKFGEAILTFLVLKKGLREPCWKGHERRVGGQEPDPRLPREAWAPRRVAGEAREQSWISRADFA